MGVHAVAELGVVRDRIKVAALILAPVLADSRHGISRAIWACPNHIGLSKQPYDVFCGQLGNVFVEVNVFKPLVPFHGENLMPMRFKRLAD